MLIWTNTCHSWKEKTFFLDRDGVLNLDRPDYIKHWHEFKFYSDSLKALREIRQKGINAVLISNQSALNRGLISWQDFWDIHNRMIAAIEAEGGSLQAAFYCPHRPDENCPCRKPAPGMLISAAALFGISLKNSIFIGDRNTDLLAAKSAGCQAVLLEREAQHDSQSGEPFAPLYVRRFSSLWEAVCELS
jgi:D-glycero-D-manno-heptose 1,7-bisphosphate phosphatase